uniref:Transcriptional regulator n=1 Tax=mine drainage metagenome TaxID=410659 RepID=E6QV52_9ZZZZ
MPEIARFFGIVIYMNWREHPPVHFHAVYGEHEALITLDGKVYSGSFLGRALFLVREWLAIHRDDVAADWELAMAKKPLNPIEPLE